MKIKFPHRMGLFRLSLLAIVVGAIAGISAVLFTALIALIHNFTFLGTFGIHYDSSRFTPVSPWGALVILVPVLGGLIVTFLVENYAPEARGHGVPEVMDAIYYKDGVIRPIVAVIKSVASAVAIGTGASVGREGPIIQTGATLGSTLGQIIHMAPWQRITLVAAGAGAGIAATFNTPIGGVMFAVELLMPEVSARTFLPVALATGTATFIGSIFYGIHPTFTVPTALLAAENPATLGALLMFALVGAVIGVASTAFIRGLSFAEDSLELIKNAYLRSVLAMSSVGILMYVMLRTAGHYYVEGVGYATIQAILTEGMSLPGLLILLFVAKLFATSASLGSGSSGGIFSPSLVMGATVGAACGSVITHLYPVPGVTPVTGAIVGMAGMIAGGTGAAMTAVTMTFEMTRDYALVMPCIIAVAMAVGVRRILSRESIYTIKLVQRGHQVPKAMHANMFLVRSAGAVMERDVTMLPAEADFDAFLRQHASDRGFKHVVVTRGNHIAGVVRVNTSLRRGIEAAYKGVTFGDIAQHNFTLARENDIMFDVVQRMARRHAAMAVVTRQEGRWRPAEIVGIISKEDLADSVADSIKPFG